MRAFKRFWAIVMAAMAFCLLVSEASAQPATLRFDAWSTSGGAVHSIVQSNGIVYIGGEFTSVSMLIGNGAAFSMRTGVPYPLPRINGTINAVVSDGAGGWYVGGNFTTVTMRDIFARRHLIHILANGALDPVWRPEPDSLVTTLAMRGSIVYAGGRFINIGGQPRRSVAALDATTGQAINPWNSNTNGTGAVRALAVEGRRIYVGGTFTHIGGLARNRVAALDSTTGSAIPSWDPNVNPSTSTVSTDVEVSAIDVSGPTVYIGGTFISIIGKQPQAQTRNNIAAIDTAGNLLLSWNPNATTSLMGGKAAVRAIVVSDNTVYVGGSFTTIGTRERRNIAALDANGMSTPWNPNANASVFALAINGGAIYVGGRFTNIGTESRFRLAAINADKGTALPWNANLVSTSATSDTTITISALAISGLTVYAGGNFNVTVTIPRNRVAAFDASTGRPTMWNPNAPGGAVKALAVSGSTVYAGGTFTSIGGAAVRNRLAALDTVNGNAAAWNPNVESVPMSALTEISTIDVARGIVYIGGLFTNIGGNNMRSNVAAIDSIKGTPIPSFNPLTFDKQVRSLVVRGSVVYVGGEFTRIGTDTTRKRLAALNASDASLSTTWNPIIPNASDTVRVLALSDSTVYVGGKFTTVSGQLRNSIVAINARTGIPTLWNPNVQNVIGTTSNPGFVFSITVDSPRVYLGGRFNRVGGETRNNAAAVNVTDGNPVDWNPSITGTAASVNAIETGGSTIFAGGSFTTIGSIPGVTGITHTNFAPLGETPLNPVPTVLSMSPTVGARLQTLEVTFMGADFMDDVSSVNVGNGIAVNSITVTSGKTILKANITITERAGIGTRYFSVTNNPPGGGTSPPIPFTVNNPAPTIVSTVPVSGQRGQTLNVTVTGSGFISGVSTVSFGPDIAVNSITVMSTTQMTANITISANAAIGGRDVTVTNAFPGGGTAKGAFAVNYPVPMLLNIAPMSGNRLETLDVVFTGAGFVMGTTTVNTGDSITVNSITVTSATSLTANLTIAANAATGPRAFSLTNAQPGGGASESKTFTINNPAPTLTRLNPPIGGRGQTQDVILIGTNFIAGASTVSFGADITVTLVTVNSDTQITAKITIPFGVELGSREVSVTNAAPGGGTAARADGFTVINPRPTLISVTPTIGSLSQTLDVDLAGTNFIAGVSRVSFGDGISVNHITVVSSTQIIANITIAGWASLGAHDVTITNADPVFGDPAVLPNAFAVSDGAIVHFSVPADLRGAGGDTVEVPLNIDPVTREVASFDAKLGFNPQVLTFIDYARGSLLSSTDWQIDVNPGADAINLGAFAAKKAITRAGTAIVLHFRVNDTAAPGTTVPLLLGNLAATNVTANALPTDGANGLFIVPTEAGVSGTLFYFVENKPLAGDTVRVEIDDPEIRLQISDENGQFEFTDIPLGSNVLLAPRRISGNVPRGTITAGDALKAFKGRSGGPEPLNGYESLAADVTGDCQLTSGDALAILRRATGKWESFQNFGQDDWRFVDAGFNLTPENWCEALRHRLYEPLVEDQTNQNFTGVILGDVNGSFGSALGKIAAENERKGPVVTIADPSFDVGSERIDFAVEVRQADAAYNSFDLTLNFEAAIRVTAISLGAMLAPEDWEMDWNAGPQGVLRIAGFSKSADCITGNGILVVIQATLARPAKEGEALTFSMPLSLFGLNGEETPVQSASEKLTFNAKLPQQYALEQNYPNPFVSRIAERASHTVIRYALPEAGAVSLRIYDMLGQTVRTLASGLQAAGIHTIAWNGRKDNGAPAATGVYLYRLEAGNVVKTNKLILQK